MQEILVAPAKREVAKLKAQLGALESGNIVTVTCQTSRYGIYIVTGEARITDFDDLYVGTQLVGGRLEADGTRKPTELLRAMGDPIVIEDADIMAPGEHPGHGDLVQAWFSEKYCGEFTITGVATSSEFGKQTCVGDWIIPAVNTRVALLARAGDHFEPAPSPRPPMMAD